MRYNTHTMMPSETTDDVKRWFLAAIDALWPIALGSVSLRRSPCIRENCSACASGEGHSSYALSGYQDGRRYSIYVPADLASQIADAIENGHQMQALMKEAGVRYVHAVKREKRLKEEG